MIRRLLLTGLLVLSSCGEPCFADERGIDRLRDATDYNGTPSTQAYCLVQESSSSTAKRKKCRDLVRSLQDTSESDHAETCDTCTTATNADYATLCGSCDTATNADFADLCAALAADGSDCSAGQYARGVDAAGNAELCAADADTTCLDAGVNCLFAASVSEGGPATTAAALAANGGNCSAGSYPLGVDAAGAVESCTTAYTDENAQDAIGSMVDGTLVYTDGTPLLGVDPTLAITSLTLSSLTAGRVPIVSTAGLLADDAGLLYDASTDQLTSGIFKQGANNAGGFYGLGTGASAANDFRLFVNASNEWELRHNVGGALSGIYRFGAGAAYPTAGEDLGLTGTRWGAGYFSGLVRASSLNATLSGSEFALPTDHVAMFSHRPGGGINNAYIGINSQAATTAGVRLYTNGALAGELSGLTNGTDFVLQLVPDASFGKSMILDMDTSGDFVQISDNAGVSQFKIMGATGASSNTITMFGKFGVYNNIATVQGGVPAMRGEISGSGLSVGLGATTIYAAPATGFYRFNFYIERTTAATTSSTLTPGLLFTGGDSNVAQTITLAANATNSTTLGALAGTHTVYARTGTNIQLQIGYASVGATAMVYRYRAAVEAL